jgi:hypothetical protein
MYEVRRRQCRRYNRNAKERQREQTGDDERNHGNNFASYSGVRLRQFDGDEFAAIRGVVRTKLAKSAPLSQFGSRG